MFDTEEKIREALASGQITQQQAQEYFMDIRLNSSGTNIFNPNTTQPTEPLYPWEQSVPQNIQESDIFSGTVPAPDPQIVTDWMIKNYRANPMLRDQGFVMPQTVKEVTDLFASGALTIEERDRLREQVLSNEYTPDKKLQSKSGEYSPLFSNKNGYLPMTGGWGSDLSTELYTLGRSIGAPKGQKGRVLTGIAAGGAAGLDIARNLTAGIGFEKRDKYIDDWYKQQQQKVRFQSDSQTQDSNYLGVLPFKYGGVFQDGGEMETPTVVEAQPQMGQPQQGSQDPLQQMGMAVAEMLQQGMKPQEVLATLVEQGVPQQQAVQIIEMVLQEMQQPQQEQPQQQAQESEELPRMKNGGIFNYKVGDFVELNVGGKIKKGKILKIENGKVYL
jgi:hypothetical protein